MQFIVISHQLLITLYSVILGAVMGAIYDGVRFLTAVMGARTVSERLARRLPAKLKKAALRRRGVLGRKAADLMVNLADILYFLTAAAVFCAFLYTVNSGCFRWFLMLGALSGLFLYEIGPGRLIWSILECCALLTRAFAGVLLFGLTRPAVWMVNGIQHIAEPIRIAAGVRKTERIRKRLCTAVRFSAEK